MRIAKSPRTSTASLLKRLSRERVRKPCAIVRPYFDSVLARSLSTWIHCRSPVASANASIRLLIDHQPVCYADFLTG